MPGSLFGHDKFKREKKRQATNRLQEAKRGSLHQHRINFLAALMLAK